MMVSHFPKIAECGFETRTDECGKAVHAARIAVESDHSKDVDLIEALEELEAIVGFSFTDSPPKDEVVREFESYVRDAWWSSCDPMERV